MVPSGQTIAIRSKGEYAGKQVDGYLEVSQEGLIASMAGKGRVIVHCYAEFLCSQYGFPSKLS